MTQTNPMEDKSDTRWDRKFYARDGALLHADTSPLANDELTLHLTTWTRAIAFDLKVHGNQDETHVLHYHERGEGNGASTVEAKV